ncbi:hypothetical protein P4O66_004743 [Electrophorus voltai]|uniref:Uncharacterized protein n=1 Tax=Electrophorus voltai TaxID=2609070 RepID=A0AAD8ZMM9_9TELE|nr:hypothetical protein P4O66_004743 [Electrophorus voltai]
MYVPVLYDSSPHPVLPPSVTETPTDEGCLRRGSKRRKGQKGGTCPSTTLAERPSIILVSLHTHTTGEKATGGFLGGPGYGPVSDSMDSYRPQPDYGERYAEDQYSDMKFTESYNPFMDYCEGYADYGGNGECSDVSLWSDLGFDCVEDLSMEVEEVLFGDPPTDSDVESAVSRSDEPPAPKIPPKAPSRKCRSGASKPSLVAHIEVNSFEEETPSTRAHSPGTRAPIPKPHRGKKEATPVPTPETTKVTGAPPEKWQEKLPPPKLASGDPPQVVWTSGQLTTGGQARALFQLIWTIY